MAQSTTYGSREAGTGVQQLKDKAQEKVEQATSQIEGAANAIAEQGREVTENVQIVAGNIRGAVEKSVRDQPLTTLAMTAAVAFVLGAIWKS